MGLMHVVKQCKLSCNLRLVKLPGEFQLGRAEHGLQSALIRPPSDPIPIFLTSTSICGQAHLSC